MPTTPTATPHAAARAQAADPRDAGDTVEIIDGATVVTHAGGDDGTGAAQPAWRARVSQVASMHGMQFDECVAAIRDGKIKVAGLTLPPPEDATPAPPAPAHPTSAPTTRPAAHTDLGRFLDDAVYPGLYLRLETALPEYGWTERGRAKVATRWPADFPLTVEHQNPDRLQVYADGPWGIKVHGHGVVRFLDLVNRGKKPTGPDFLAAVRKLADLAGVPMPERTVTPEEAAATHARESRRAIIEAVIPILRGFLRAPDGAQALDYLHSRGFSDTEIDELELGYYPGVAPVREALRAAGHDLHAADDAALTWADLAGYVIQPWRDATGAPLTLYGRWREKTPPNGKPKTIALPGEGTKAHPLYLDRARRAGHHDLVAVEGVYDAALLQVRGDTRVVAYVAAQFSRGQVEALQHYRIRSVTLCGDPDGGGDKGTLANVRLLTDAGIRCYVAPRLPDGLDPDEFLVREGIDGWRAHVAQAVHGFRHVADGILKRQKPAAGWTDATRDSAAAEAVEWAAVAPESTEDDLTHHLFCAIAEATGAKPAALAKRAKAARKKREAAAKKAEEKKAAQPPPARTSATGTPSKPVIQVTTDISAVVDATEAAIIAYGKYALFQRAGLLVRIVRDTTPPKGLRRPAGSPVISVIPPKALWEIAARAAEWQTWDAKKKEWKTTMPPAWATDTLAARATWKVPPLTATIQTPTMRPDGTILSTPGYDADTGLLLGTGSTTYPPVPESPTLADAQRAYGELAAVFGDFPFRALSDLAAVISAILTLLAREAIDGCVPVFGITATTPGSGKTLIVDVIISIVTGRTAPRAAQAADEAEEKKRLLAICIEGDAAVLWDNVERAFGSAALAGAFTAGGIKDRVLGKTGNVTAPMRFVAFVTGNNLEYAGDMYRRVVPISLDPQTESPEERSGFQHADLLAWVRQERPRLVVAGLTILRAYHVAGRPRPERMSQFGSFSAWSDLARAAVLWASGHDPCAGRAALRETADPARMALGQALRAWRAALGERWVTVAEVIQWTTEHAVVTLPEYDAAEALRQALGGLDRRWDGRALLPQRIGSALRRYAGRIVGGLSFRRGESDRVATWAVVSRADSSDSSDLPREVWSKCRGNNGAQEGTETGCAFPRHGLTESEESEESAPVEEGTL